MKRNLPLSGDADDHSSIDFNPKRFMKARRPELFSDTVFINSPLFSRDEFGYRLENITAEKKEIEFEHFCRKLSEKEICPNISIQTGPTGGGDSKVDAETFPVSEKIALRWYEGIGIESANERWAFAFSAKKNWREKVKSDVKNIVDTGRNYKRIFFITNQFVKDKSRAAVEDELQEKFSISITIFDRKWIIEKIFENKCFSIIAETLGVSQDRIIEEKKVGNQDFSREEELIELDNLIKDPTRYNGAEYQLAIDCLQSALLARSLEKPISDVDGRFHRAERIAEKNNAEIQLKRIIFLHAWTMYWWYNDIFAFNSLYKKLEVLVFKSPRAWDLVWLVNLFQLAESSLCLNAISQEDANIEERRSRLRSALENIKKETALSSSNLIARTQLWILDFSEAIKDTEKFTSILKEFEALLNVAETLPEFPIRYLLDFFKEVGELIGKLVSFDDLFERVLILKSERIREGERGQLLLEQGLRKLKFEQPYEAIEYLGRSWLYLAKEEYRHQHIAMHFSISQAYESAGLLYAARAHMVIAVDLSLSNFVKKGEKIPTHTLFGFYRLIWIELKLGNIPKILAWIRLAIATEQNIYLTNEQKEAAQEEYQAIDTVLGILLLKTKYTDLVQLEQMPNILKEFGLTFARAAILYALGYELPIRDELKSEGDLDEFFSKCLDQPVNEDLPVCPSFFIAQNKTLFTNVLGCQINIFIHNQKVSIFLAETLLSVLEAFLATGLIEKFAPYRESLNINIVTSEINDQLFNYTIEENDCGEPTVKVIFPVKKSGITNFVKEENYHKNIVELVVKIVELIAIIPSFDSSLTIKEEIFKRALNISESPIALNNLLDPDVKIQWRDWADECKSFQFSLTREKSWYDKPKSPVMKDLKFLEKKPEIDFQINNMKHRQQKVFNLIDVRLWENAKWVGFASGITNIENTPFVALQFQDISVGNKIFRGWIKRLGSIDENDLIGITILTEINSRDPLLYRVIISTNIQAVSVQEEIKQIVQISRPLTLKAKNVNALDNFKLLNDKDYFIVPISSSSQKILPELLIKKKKIRVISAREIEENDPVISSIMDHDK